MTEIVQAVMCKLHQELRASLAGKNSFCWRMEREQRTNEEGRSGRMFLALVGAQHVRQTGKKSLSFL